MVNIEVDIAIIGAGTAGLAAYRAAKKQGKHVLLIEGGPGGTTCAKVGCMPSKLLIAAANAAHQAKSLNNKTFGVHVDGIIRIEGKEVMDRVRRERDRFVEFVHESVDTIPADDKLQGWANFLTPHTLRVVQKNGTDVVVKATSIVIATGSRPYYPEVLEALGDRLVVNDDVFAWKKLPKSVAVLGTGVIGLELGQALHRLGVRTTIFGRSPELHMFADENLQKTAKALLTKELPLHLGATIKSMKLTEEHMVEIVYLHPDGTWHAEEFDYLLTTTGRLPNLESLNINVLANGESNITVHEDTLHIEGQQHVFVAGDANGLHPILHEAADDGAMAGYNAANYPDVRPWGRRAALKIVFTEPQMAMVGPSMTTFGEETFVTGRVDFSNQGRARVMLENAGVLHVYVGKKTRQFLGAEMIGPAAEHIGHLLAWALHQALTVDDMLEMPFYHPVVEEGLRTALRDAKAQLEDSA